MATQAGANEEELGLYPGTVPLHNLPNWPLCFQGHFPVL